MDKWNIRPLAPAVMALTKGKLMFRKLPEKIFPEPRAVHGCSGT
jgi:hypothetical protein